MTDLREQWIQKICTRIATSSGRHPLLDPARIVGDTSDLDLIRALLVLQIAVLDVVSVGESAVADEGCGYADEGQEVFGLSLV
ncbi:hypothetical protein AB0907_38080, partial [Streptomyces sp. NPDC006975]|uniref:hypothetical protein n=1 Tax=Streptomyces sp. NPDC006975 TaxID=3154310 RepID=UPI00345114D5